MTSTISRPAKVGTVTNLGAPGGTQDTQRADLPATTTQPSPAGADPRPAKGDPIPTFAAPGGTELAGRHRGVDVHTTCAASDQPADRQMAHVARDSDAVGSGGEQGRTAVLQPMPTHVALSDPALSSAAEILDDIESIRIANENRLRTLTRGGPADERIRSGKVASVFDLPPDQDGEVRGFGLEADHPDVGRLAGMVLAMHCKSRLANNLGYTRAPRTDRKLPCCLEHDAIKNLEQKMRKHPLGPWADSMKGVGHKQCGRLLAALGDPYIRPVQFLDDGTEKPEGPRTVAALWKYCGLDVVHADDAGVEGGDPGHTALGAQRTSAGVARKRRKGQQSRWNAKAKKCAWLIAKSCVRQLAKPCAVAEGVKWAAHVDGCRCSPYRLVYDSRRAHTAITHPEWTDAHSENDALHVTSKEVLKHLWREAKRIHEAPTP